MFRVKLRVPWEKKSTWDMSPRERQKYRKWEKLREFFAELNKQFPNDVDIINKKHKAYNIDSYTEYIRMCYGYNVELRNRIKWTMRALGWHLDKEDLEKGNDRLRYTKEFETMGIHFEFNHYYDGSTCKKVKIGSETVERDVYDIVCNEAAAEMGV